MFTADAGELRVGRDDGALADALPWRRHRGLAGRRRMGARETLLISCCRNDVATGSQRRAAMALLYALATWADGAVLPALPACCRAARLNPNAAPSSLSTHSTSAGVLCSLFYITSSCGAGRLSACRSAGLDA